MPPFPAHGSIWAIFPIPRGALVASRALQWLLQRVGARGLPCLALVATRLRGVIFSTQPITPHTYYPWLSSQHHSLENGLRPGALTRRTTTMGQGCQGENAGLFLFLCLDLLFFTLQLGARRREQIYIYMFICIQIHVYVKILIVSKAIA